MSKAIADLDFFGVERDTCSKLQFQKFLEPQKSFRGVQGAISKINPQLLKNLIASGTTFSEGNRQEHLLSSPSTPAVNQNFLRTLPVLIPVARSTSEIPPESAQLTIFYNGTVRVFDVPSDKAEIIMNFAQTELPAPKLVASSSKEAGPFDNLSGADLPIARKHSLRRFLEKRKERMTLVSPYDLVAACGGQEDKDSVRS
ncbi:hypothetical protein NE237_005918 [Protea cynaroides]|uniref:Protein TIFY n=1 Tax=Protea cynaroides TaxID=273540 RepID=A0A9Q0KM37_9MAGN|nr:hypothetical protein NE237_005918 [Protea cynaroides]